LRHRIYNDYEGWIISRMGICGHDKVYPHFELFNWAEKNGFPTFQINLGT
jgi:hypothetical protein